MNAKNVALFGLGHHCRKVIWRCLKENHVRVNLLVELESARKTTLEFLRQNAFDSPPTNVLFLPLNRNDLLEQNSATDVFSATAGKLLNLKTMREKPSSLSHAFSQLQTTPLHSIISTDARSHFAYVKFNLQQAKHRQQHIHVLVDKPLSAPSNLTTDSKQVEKINTEYNEIMSLLQSCQPFASVDLIVQRFFFFFFFFFAKFLLIIIIIIIQIKTGIIMNNINFLKMF